MDHSRLRLFERAPAGLRWGLFAAYVLWLLVLTLAPLPDSAGGLPAWFDKFAHWGLFAGFAALLYWARVGQRAQAAAIVGWSAVLAAAIEVVQTPLPFRSGDPWDWAWGVVGAFVGYGAARAVLRGER